MELNRLKEIREDHDLAQTDIANLLHTSRQQVAKWERGAQKMGIDKYIILAKYYNLSLDYLTGLVDEPKPLYENS
ncbi:MAG: helix-turn-helix transcriptional regulator [Clostridia bacterium]|nr:helix-turn-helix transcriptional regulator [Clostridia bacterium]